MRSDKPVTDKLAAKDDDYEATVLGFLDQEITASSGSGEEENRQQDDVDVLLDGLLQQSMTAPSEPQVARETGSEDLDLLFSRLLKHQEAMLQTESKHASPEPGVRLSQTLKEIGVVDKGSVNIRPVEKPGKRETEPASVLQAANDHDAAAAAAVHSPFARMAMNPPAVLKSDFDRTVAAADTSETSRRAPVFSLAARKSARNLQMSIVAGACLFLLAGAGIIYFTGMMGSTPSGAGKAAPATAQPAPAKVEAPAAPQSLPIAAVASKTSPVRPLRTVDSASTAAATSNSSSRNPAPTKESKPAVTEPQEAPATTKAGSTSTPPAAAAAAEKGTVLTVSAAENSSGVLPVGATTEIPLPPTILPQALSGSTLTQSVRNAAPSLEGLAVIDSAKTPLAPAPRDVVPAAVLSRVMPVYPDLARRTRTTGTVVVEVQIDEKGKVVKAIPESGPMILRAEAVNAVMQWRFKPATLGGNVIPSTSKVSIVFTGPK